MCSENLACAYDSASSPARRAAGFLPGITVYTPPKKVLPAHKKARPGPAGGLAGTGFSLYAVYTVTRAAPLCTRITALSSVMLLLTPITRPPTCKSSRERGYCRPV